jgi:hypothetical protein
MEIITDENGVFDVIYKDYFITKECDAIFAIPLGTWHHTFFAWKLPDINESKKVWENFGYNMFKTKPDFSADTLEEIKDKINN